MVRLPNCWHIAWAIHAAAGMGFSCPAAYLWYSASRRSAFPMGLGQVADAAQDRGKVLVRVARARWGEPHILLIPRIDQQLVVLLLDVSN
ncbi:MAG: hypothetical protein ACKPKO_04300, partial [Candidatus Fonsibacter sp.]